MTNLFSKKTLVLALGAVVVMTIMDFSSEQTSIGGVNEVDYQSVKERAVQEAAIIGTAARFVARYARRAYYAPQRAYVMRGGVSPHVTEQFSIDLREFNSLRGDNFLVSLQKEKMASLDD